MTARFYYSDPDLGTVEVTGRVARTGWELRENAEEGSVAMSTLVLDDPDMDLEIVGHRRFWVIEDESDATDNVLWSGYTADQEIGRTQGERREPLARAWTVSLMDLNGMWQKRAMMGADCNRPAETDVERIQWLFSTGEAGLIADDTTYVITSGGSAMDAADYRRQMLTQVIDDAAQVRGANWYLFEEETGSGRVIAAWYGRDTGSSLRDSVLFLSNDPADLVMHDVNAGTSLVWPISDDTVLRRDPGRQYDGVVVEYAKGAIYRRATDKPVSRDFVANYPNVKTKTKAEARAVRLLAQLADQNDIITTTVRLPKSKATMIRAGMRVPFKATHLPGYEDYLLMRVLSCAVKAVAAGEEYELTLELQGPGEAGATPPFTGDAFAALLGSSSAITHHFIGASGDEPSGWFLEPEVGPLAVVESADPYYSIVASEPMSVRIQGRVGFYGVPATLDTVTFTVTVNGVGVGSDTKTDTDGGIFSGLLEVDVSGIILAAGDVVSFTYTTAVSTGMDNFGNNTTYLRVGRGTISMNNGTYIWTGG